MGFDVDRFAEAYDASLRRQGVTPDPKPYRSVRHRAEEAPGVEGLDLDTFEDMTADAAWEEQTGQEIDG